MVGPGEVDDDLDGETAECGWCGWQEMNEEAAISREHSETHGLI